MGQGGEEGEGMRKEVEKNERFGMMVYVSFTHVRIQGDCHYDQYRQYHCTEDLTPFPTIVKLRQYFNIRHKKRLLLLCSSRTYWTRKWIRRRSESVCMRILYKPHCGKFDKINPPNSAQKQVRPCLARQKCHGIFSYSQNPTVFRNITLSATA